MRHLDGGDPYRQGIVPLGACLAHCARIGALWGQIDRPSPWDLTWFCGAGGSGTTRLVVHHPVSLAGSLAIRYTQSAYCSPPEMNIHKVDRRSSPFPVPGNLITFHRVAAHVWALWRGR